MIKNDIKDHQTLKKENYKYKYNWINKIQLNQQKTRMTDCPISKGLNFLRNHDTTMVESTATKKLLKANEMIQIL